jgi:hypothetical protein
MNDISHPGDYERSDADPRLIGALALGLALFLVATPFVLMTMYPSAHRSSGIPHDLPKPPAPRLQVDPTADLMQLRADETARLTSYGWVERDGRVAHIPIARAIDILSRRGLPGWPSPPPR